MIFLYIFSTVDSLYMECVVTCPNCSMFLIPMGARVGD